ncbi:CBS domain-containing protein [Oceanobacillus profundus]|uniref:CBS domain-containing protein n=1 Tax=Oceanobacillus TaxID=182709 RepID=UPI0026E43414|nr:CBS domain-containing protein [Oceanobacillus profundus]MDO6450335.1 CBS domain-containing protein [Oceanobacillus profundus]
MNRVNNPILKQNETVVHRNSDRFLTAFNRIEKGLKALLIKKEMGFSRAVKVLGKSNALIKQFQDDLLEFAELRNAIVHNKTDLMYTIAEPHDSVVERIEAIEIELLKPRKVDPLFIRKVVCFQETEPLSNVLEVVNKQGITKFPVYSGNVFQGLITHKGIKKWFSKGIENRLTSLLDARLVEVLECEKRDNFRFISKETSVYEAKEIFKEQIGKGNRLEALLITKEGSSSGGLVGIVTNWDIMEI